MFKWVSRWFMKIFWLQMFRLKSLCLHKCKRTKQCNLLIYSFIMDFDFQYWFYILYLLNSSNTINFTNLNIKSNFPSIWLYYIDTCWVFLLFLFPPKILVQLLSEIFLRESLIFSTWYYPTFCFFILYLTNLSQTLFQKMPVN